MVRKGRLKENVAGERYDSNAIQMPQSTPSRTRPYPSQFNPADLMGLMSGGSGGMPDMSQMMEMMQGMGGMPPMGMPGMPDISGMVPTTAPSRHKIIHVYGLAEGTPTSTFTTFYPNYIDIKKTLHQGRRISKEQACDTPIADEMSEICTFLRLPHVLEPAKKYPRDWMVVGRIRVRLVRDDGTLENPEIPNRKSLMIKMAELIPQLQSRKVRLENEAEEARKKLAAAAGAATPATGGGKKKGKKKGRR
ncbi:signal recognition particle 19 kda family protein [Plasmopara halstedii]|uniref:Signal recognition particle 19 kDa family protein n=1 Tax=Plasmopara halstedii TaxID=4781 RepID=A0A0P1B2Y8_PLAHL|nr:signal recognition particle 19 kda family protein [Plasmopara halstedii]CEG48428.1 signal recognition particle 19 kda family protein [Plasmopara halstedii]|eukprot:XP_024584797.1 signal recognition particle 19 kda family protein [Plasmopara halstedii]